MALEIDQRNLDRAEPAQEGRATAESFDLEGGVPDRRINPFTGTRAVLEMQAADDGGSLLDRALAHLRAAGPELAAAEEDPPELLADPQVVVTSAGEQIVHCRQHVDGIPVFQAARLVRFDREGTLREILGDHVPLVRRDLDLTPTLDAAEAVLAAGLHLAAPGGDPEEGLPGLRVTGRRPHIVAAFPLPSSPCVVRKPPFPGLISVHLVLFYRRPDLRLGWYVPLRLPGPAAQYDLIVAANGDTAGEVLFCRNVVAQAVLARVTRHNPDEEPLRLTAMPSPLAEHPSLRPPHLPAGFPGPWVDRDQTSGNNVRCLAGGRTVRGTTAGGNLTFQPAAGSHAELAVNAFFLCNELHDFFYLLGFDEAAGNFQHRNPAGAGRGNDEVEIRIFDVVRGDATMLTEVDGRNAQMSLGRIRLPDGTFRHTALDADVVIHELVHAVSARLVGGRSVWRPLVSGPPQARALDEGTSDYFALTFQNHRRLRAGRPERLVYGAWSSGNPVTGRRRVSYAGFAHRFSQLGRPGFTDPHDAGMIWCAALLAMNRGIGTALGSLLRGHEIGWQLVVNALKQLPTGQDAPSFLDGRDALLRALAALREAIPQAADGPLFPPDRFDALDAAVRRAFADLGMGRNARSRGGSFADLVDDMNP